MRQTVKKALLLGLALSLLAGAAAGCAPAADSAFAARLGAVQTKESTAKAASARFDAGSKWDWMKDDFDLDITTGEPPREGVVFRAELLVRSSAKPKFTGRMNVEVVLLVGQEKRWVQCAVPAQVRAIDLTGPITRDGAAWYKTDVEVTFAGTVETDVNGKWTSGVAYHQAVDQAVAGVKVRIAGTLCGYKGTVRLENAALAYTMEGRDGVSVHSTVPRRSATGVAVQNGALAVENGGRYSLPQVKLADPKAAQAAAETARYLAAMGNSDHVIFGHQDSVWSKSGTPASPLNGLTGSDVEDITGSPAGVVGLDGLSLVGLDFSAKLWNQTFAPQGMAEIDIQALGEPAANVKALASLSNYCLDRGALVTLSCHMPNFTQVKERPDYQAGKEPGYARYDFSASTVRDRSGDPVKSILPGGAHNAEFTAYLDMIADYAVQVDGAVIFRPFHEGTGSWFWWGTKTCDARTYQRLFRYTVTYLRDQKQVHNLLYVYSPDGSQSSMKEIVERYPGDTYVDIIGLDIYQTDPAPDSGKWFAGLSDSLTQLGKFAAQHGKLLALTETGVNTSVPAPGDVATGLLRSGCPDRKWFEKLLDTAAGSNACYALVWLNNEEMFHIPFVRSVDSGGGLYGHELLDDFLRFYNDRRSVFAADQAEIVKDLRNGQPS